MTIFEMTNTVETTELAGALLGNPEAFFDLIAAVGEDDAPPHDARTHADALFEEGFNYSIEHHTAVEFLRMIIARFDRDGAL